MNDSSDRDENRANRSARARGGKGKFGAKSKAGGVAILVLAGIYSFAAPTLNARFGWNLPQIKTDSQGNVRLADSSAARTDRNQNSGQADRSESKVAMPDQVAVEATVDAGQATKSNSKTDSQTKKKDSPATTQDDKPTSPKTKSSRGPLADRIRTSKSNSSDQARGPPQSPRAGTGTGTKGTGTNGATEDLRYGLLREVSRDRYLSPAGLQYTPGSAEGHRLEHLRRHTKDMPGRPGSHGVFDGEMEGALKTIDRAYDRAKKGQRTTKQVDGNRTIYTVDMGGRVGFVGGRDGKRKRNPMARRVRLVLEGNRVITAFPL